MVGNILNVLKARFSLALAFVLVVSCIAVVDPPKAHAAQLGARGVYILSSSASATTEHIFTVTYTTGTDAIGSVQLEYCLSPLLGVPCVAPTGMDASTAVLSDQTGETGFTIQSQTNNAIVLTRLPVAPATGTPSTYTFDGVKNPSVIDTFFVRITTYITQDATGSYTDFGGVANAVTTGVAINGEVPPYLRFCVGLSITGDCSTATGNLIDLGTLSTNHVSTGSSQMLAATNAAQGLVIVVYGTTMTSGNNVISPLGNPTPSAPGNSQFGLNLRANTSPAIGEDPSGGGVAAPATRYNTPNRFAFVSGDTVAQSSDVTDNRKFTASYIVNVTPAQQPGVYTSTLTYICSATF